MDTKQTMWEMVQVWASARGGDLLVGAAAIALVWFLIELFKPWLKIVFAHLGVSEKVDDAVFKTLPYLVGCLAAVVLEFPLHWESLTGFEVKGWRAVILGAVLTGGGAHVSYYLTRKLEVIKTLKLRWQRFNGVTQADLDKVREAKKDEPLLKEYPPDDTTDA